MLDLLFITATLLLVPLVEFVACVVFLGAGLRSLKAAFRMTNVGPGKGQYRGNSGHRALRARRLLVGAVLILLGSGIGIHLLQFLSAVASSGK